MRDIMNHCALAYLVDPGNRAYYIQKIVSTMEFWSDLFALMDVPDAAWTEKVPPGTAFFMSVLALDIVYADLTPEQRSNVEAKLRPIATWYSTGWHWPHNTWGTRVIWALYTKDRAAIDRAKQGYRNELFGPGGPHNRGYVSPSGAYTAGSGYAWSKLGGAHDRGAAKTGTMDVLTFTGEDEYYDDPRIERLYAWLFRFALTPFRNHSVFGDSYVRRSDQPWVTFRLLTLGRFSDELAAQAAWAIDGSPPPRALSLLAYVVADTPLPAPKKPKSAIFEDGGAAFWQDDPSDESIMGALLNMRNSEWHTPWRRTPRTSLRMGSMSS